jgi:hypothetical protein
MRRIPTLVAFVASFALGLGFAHAGDTSVPKITNSTPSVESTGNSTSSPNGVSQNDNDESAAESAKMGKAEGTQTGGGSQGTSDNDTQKIEQPPRQNPTTGQQK